MQFSPKLQVYGNTVILDYNEGWRYGCEPDEGTWTN